MTYGQCFDNQARRRRVATGLIVYPGTSPVDVDEHLGPVPRCRQRPVAAVAGRADRDIAALQGPRNLRQKLSGHVGAVAAEEGHRPVDADPLPGAVQPPAEIAGALVQHLYGPDAEAVGQALSCAIGRDGEYEPRRGVTEPQGRAPQHARRPTPGVEGGPRTVRRQPGFRPAGRGVLRHQHGGEVTEDVGH